jgi:hypothetical protein
VAVLGRGKRYAQHEGNRRLRELVQSQLPCYLASTNRKDKTTIIIQVIQTMRNGTEGQVGLVRHANWSGNWFTLEDDTARVKVAQMFRDALSKHYRSSKHYTRMKRQAIKEQKAIYSPDATEDDFLANTPSAPGEKGEDKPSSAFSHTMGTQGRPSLSSVVFLQPNARADSETLMVSGAINKKCLGTIISDTHNFLVEVREHESNSDAQRVFDSLFEVFAEGVNIEANPYEPTPIAFQASPSMLCMGDILSGDVL